jgi:cyanophycinase
MTGDPNGVRGTLALVGGLEWTESCDFDAELLEASGGSDVLVLPTAAAMEHPDKAVEQAREWFGGIGGRVTGLDVLQRSDALDPANAAAVREARFVYLAGGSPLHLRSVLKETPLWDALVDAWADGAVIAGSSAGAMVLGDPMIDPRGGAFTVGLGLVPNLAILPHAESDVATHHKRTFELADPGLVVAAIPECTALVRDPSGEWRSSGAGIVTVWVDGEQRGFAALPEIGPIPPRS